MENYKTKMSNLRMFGFRMDKDVRNFKVLAENLAKETSENNSRVQAIYYLIERVILAEEYITENIGVLKEENKLLREICKKYLSWLGVKDVEYAFNHDLLNPKMLEMWEG
jgi:hypothetical protein